MARTNAFRGRKVHVVEEKCSTCIFRPGNLMTLQPGRVKGMVEDSIAEDGAITCHKTLEDRALHAVCRGFWDSYRQDVTPLRMAEAIGIVEFDPPVGA